MAFPPATKEAWLYSLFILAIACLVACILDWLYSLFCLKEEINKRWWILTVPRVIAGVTFCFIMFSLELGWVANILWFVGFLIVYAVLISLIDHYCKE